MEELLELFDIATERQSRLAKIMAAAMGADVGGDEEIDLTGTKVDTTSITGANEASALPFSIGYGKID